MERAVAGDKHEGLNVLLTKSNVSFLGKACNCTILISNLYEKSIM